MAAGRQRGRCRVAPGRGLSWCGPGSRVRRRAGSFPAARSRRDHPGRDALDMRGRRFGWKWGLLVGAPMAVLSWSAFRFAAHRRLPDVGFGGHAPAMRSSGWYGREAANRMTAAASSSDRLWRRMLPGAAGQACGVGAGSCGCCGAGVSAARSRLPPGLLFGPFPGGFLAEALGVQFQYMAMMDEAVLPIHSCKCIRLPTTPRTLAQPRCAKAHFSCGLYRLTNMVYYGEAPHRAAVILKPSKGANRSMKSKAAASVRASISFPPDVYRLLKQIAKKKKVSLAWVVRDAVEQYVTEHQELLEQK